MERQNNRLTDCINTDIQGEFTMIPKSLIYNTDISLKAKAVLSILLSNKDGWKSFKVELLNKIKEGTTLLENTLKELEEAGYLARIRYRKTNPNQWAGSFWCYTSIPYDFAQEKIDKHVETLVNNGFTLQPDSYNIGTYNKEAILLQTAPNNNNIIIKNKKNNKAADTRAHTHTRIRAEAAAEKKQSNKKQFITPGKFDLFWKLYPVKQDKGKCKTKWEKLCKNKNRPTWFTIKKAIKEQKQTDRWRKGYIPLPYTWLNNQRWLDDPAQMKDREPIKADKNKPTSGIDYDEGVVMD